MTKERYRKLFVGVALLSLVCLFVYMQKRQLPIKDQPMDTARTERAEKVWEEEFLKKNKESIDKLESLLAQLIAEMPTLGVTGRTFNQSLEPLIEVLAKCPTENYEENWQVFQKDFAYAYEEWNKQKEVQKNLPKEVEDSQQKIIRILQELNQVIQSMNK